MDLIDIIAGLFLNLSIGCNALPAEVQRVHGQDFLVKAWACQDKREQVHVWRTWQRECVANNGNTFWGRAYFIEDQSSQMAFYTNRFGELQGGFGAAIENAYLGPCGS